MDSGVVGVRSLIRRLRTKDDDDLSAYESFSNTMNEYMDGNVKGRPTTSTPKPSNRAKSIVFSRGINDEQQPAEAQATGASKSEEEVNESSPQKVLNELSRSEKSRMRLRDNAKGRHRSRSRAQRGNGAGTVKWEAY